MTRVALTVRSHRTDARHLREEWNHRGITNLAACRVSGGWEVLGGRRQPFKKGRACSLTVGGGLLTIAENTGGAVIALSASEIHTMDVNGHGVTRRRGGFIGGGFGAKGMVEGMLIAGVLNSLTSGEEAAVATIDIVTTGFSLALRRQGITPRAVEDFLQVA